MFWKVVAILIKRAFMCLLFCSFIHHFIKQTKNEVTLVGHRTADKVKSRTPRPTKTRQPLARHHRENVSKVDARCLRISCAHPLDAAFKFNFLSNSRCMGRHLPSRCRGKVIIVAATAMRRL